LWGGLKQQALLTSFASVFRSSALSSKLEGLPNKKPPACAEGLMFRREDRISYGEPFEGRPETTSLAHFVRFGFSFVRPFKQA
jgi:hypothetical protein